MSQSQAYREALDQQANYGQIFSDLAEQTELELSHDDPIVVKGRSVSQQQQPSAKKAPPVKKKVLSSDAFEHLAKSFQLPLPEVFSKLAILASEITSWIGVVLPTLIAVPEIRRQHIFTLYCIALAIAILGYLSPGGLTPVSKARKDWMLRNGVIFFVVLKITEEFIKAFGKV